MEYSKIKLKIANLNLSGKNLSQRNLIDIKKHFKSLDINSLKEELYFIIDTEAIDNEALRSFLLVNFKQVLSEMRGDNNDLLMSNTEKNRIKESYDDFKMIILNSSVPMFESDDNISPILLGYVKKHFDTLTKEQLVDELYYIVDNSSDELIKSPLLTEFINKNYSDIYTEMLENMNVRIDHWNSIFYPSK